MRVTSEHTVSLFDHTRINFARSSSDPLFDSVAAVYGPRAVGVVLSGTGRNGAAGAKRLHDVGATVLAQDRATAEYFAMPHAAIELGAVDWVLPVDRVARALIALTRHPRRANGSA